MQEKQDANVEEEILEKEKDLKQEESLEESDDLDQEEFQEKETEKDIAIANLAHKLQDTEQHLLRLQADFDNYKKRVIKEKESISKYALENIAKELLPILDNFERALTSLKENEEENTGYIQGIEMVYNQFVQTLEKQGVTEILALGESFDPNLHHAVAQESKDDCEDNTIIEVYQKGYKLKDKVIRASMVKVCIHS